MAPGQKMKWFKFVIYFLLYANGIGYGISAAVFLLAPVFDMAYSAPELLYGLLGAGFAVWCLVLRRKLSRFEWGAHRMYMTYRVVNTVFSLVREFIAYNAGTYLQQRSDFVPTVIGVILTIVFIALEYDYFRKREGLFVN